MTFNGRLKQCFHSSEYCGDHIHFTVMGQLKFIYAATEGSDVSVLNVSFRYITTVFQISHIPVPEIPATLILHYSFGRILRPLQFILFHVIHYFTVLFFKPWLTLCCCLTTLWASTACYMDSFTFLPANNLDSFITCHCHKEIHL
jgi:hypothetical protein